MIDAITKVTLYVKNQREAKAFWVEKMKFQVTLEQPMGPNMTWLEVAPSNAQTAFVLYEKELMQKQNPQTNVAHPSLILSCQDIKTVYQMLQQAMVKVDPLQVMPYGKMFTFYDQDQNAYLLRED